MSKPQASGAAAELCTRRGVPRQIELYSGAEFE
jgi:hypothetical protein